jgi:hypothetical protein
MTFRERLRRGLEQKKRLCTQFLGVQPVWEPNFLTTDGKVLDMADLAKILNCPSHIVCFTGPG